MRRILFLIAPESIHDFKWVSAFLNRHDIYAVLAYEAQNKPKSSKSIQRYGDRVVWLPAIPSWSLKNYGATKKSQRLLNEAIAKHDIEVVHVMYAAPHALWIPGISTPSIITTRGSDVLLNIPALRSTKGLRGLHDRMLYRRFRRAFDQCSFTTSTSETQRQAIVQHFGPSDKYTIVRTGVEVEQIANFATASALPGELRSTRFILFPRLTGPIYDTLLQIEAIRNLDQQLKTSFTFVFIRGLVFDQDYYVKVKAAIQSIPEVKFIYFDWLEQEQLWACYKQADLVVMTPTSDGTPNSALEAMAARTPLILPDLPYDADLFDGHALVLKERTPEALASLMQNALNNPNPEMLERAYEAVRRHANRPTEMKRLETLYDKAIASCATTPPSR